MYAVCTYVHENAGVQTFLGSGSHKVTITQYLVVWSFDSPLVF
jgi:hypothetical protein